MTTVAERQLKGLRGRQATAARRVIEELLAQRCKAAGYRLAGSPLDHICCRHLDGSDRMLTAWLDSDHVVILGVGPHNRSATDVYLTVLDTLGIDMPPDERTKPPCCDNSTSLPIEAQAAEMIIDAIGNLARQRRRASGRT